MDAAGLALLPWERSIARRNDRRFQRQGLPSDAQIDIVRKYGSRGLVLFGVASEIGMVSWLIGAAGTAYLFISGGATAAYFIMSAGVLGALYTICRLHQMRRLRPSDADIKFLESAAQN